MLAAEQLARFLTEVARAADRLAAELMGVERDEAADDSVIDHLGSRQAEVYSALYEGDKPLTTGQIAKAIGYDFSNCYLTLHRLEEIGIVERVPGIKPQTWRLKRPS